MSRSPRVCEIRRSRRKIFRCPGMGYILVGQNVQREEIKQNVRPRNSILCLNFKNVLRRFSFSPDLKCPAKDPWFAGRNVQRNSKSFRVLWSRPFPNTVTIPALFTRPTVTAYSHCQWKSKFHTSNGENSMLVVTVVAQLHCNITSR